MDIHGPLQTRGETRCPGGVSVSCLASRTRHECPSLYTHKFENCLSLLESNYSTSVLISKKAVFALPWLVHTFHAINIPAGWKLKASVSTAGAASVQHQGRNKHATAHVWNIWPNRDKKERLVYCSFHSLGFEILLFESCFEGTYGCCCCFENRLIKVYLYTWKLQNACPRAYVFKFFLAKCIIRWLCWKSNYL